MSMHAYATSMRPYNNIYVTKTEVGLEPNLDQKSASANQSSATARPTRTAHGDLPPADRIDGEDTEKVELRSAISGGTRTQQGQTE